MKMNSLVDPGIIDRLYAASAAGVSIDLVVRGICCLRPGVPGLSDNIRVRSLIGRYLEHSRIFHFANGAGPGSPVTYIGSADLMPRNLDRRVEAAVPIIDPSLQRRVIEVLDTVLDDDVLAWTLGPDGSWRRVAAAADAPERNAHLQFQELALGRVRHPEVEA
jgi:polyphosphate kinase